MKATFVRYSFFLTAATALAVPAAVDTATPIPSTTAAPAATSAPPVSGTATQAASPKPTPPPRTDESAVTPAVKDPHRHNAFLYRAKEDEVGLLFLGDSITDGWPRGGEVSWLKFAPYKPANFGIGGDRTEHVLWRITNGELDGINPKVTVLLIGTNNIGHFADEKPEWVAAGVKKIVETVHEKLPQTKVLLLGIFPRATKGNPLRQKIEQANAILATFGDSKKTWYLDIGSKFLDDQGEIPKDVMGDKLHPSAKGYGIWHEAMQPTLDKLLNEDRPAMKTGPKKAK